MVDDSKKISFLPFHAINEFMRPDYRLTVIRSTLEALPNLPESTRTSINNLTKKLVKIPGFRNSVKAPLPLRVKPTAEAFEKNPILVAAILSAWAEAHSQLRYQVYTLLKSRSWEVLPPEADRTKLPGFLTTWPRGEDFEVLNVAFREMYPEVQVSSDDVSLMTVWVSGRLPYQFFNEDQPQNISASISQS